MIDVGSCDLRESDSIFRMLWVYEYRENERMMTRCFIYLLIYSFFSENPYEK